MNYDMTMRIRANYMTNVVPQTKELNGGLWERVEYLTECNRDVGIHVLGGNIYYDPSNDYFLKSHGVRTPEYMWKVLFTGRDIIAYLFPNANGLGQLDDYIVSVDEIEDMLNDGLGPIKVPKRFKSKRSRTSWECNEFRY
jgi:endonuclease G, mitochondrial